MGTKAVDIVISAYNQLDLKEKIRVSKYILESQSGLRFKRLLAGEDLEHVSESEKIALNIAKSFNYKTPNK